MSDHSEAVRWMWEALEHDPRALLTATSTALDQIEARGYRIETDLYGYIKRVEEVVE